MLTGEWGCGKTYFVEHALTEKLEEDESRHPVVVASAYGAKDLAELCGAIESGFISKYAIGCAAGGERGRWDSLVGFANGHGISFLGKKIRELEKKAGVDLKMAPLNAVNLIIGPETLLVIETWRGATWAFASCSGRSTTSSSAAGRRSSSSATRMSGGKG